MSDQPKKRPSIAVIDDHVPTAQLVGALLADEDWDLEFFETAQDALEKIKRQDSGTFDLVLSDIFLPGMNGFDFLRQLRKFLPETPVVLMTSSCDIELSIQAIRTGAFDFILKPFEETALKQAIRRALSFYKSRSDQELIKAEIKSEWKYGDIIGRSERMRSIFDLIDKVAPTSATVLVTGESGTGKELVARAIHARSPRKEFPFVAINCSAIPRELLESEFFGHARGAFTGAVHHRKGLFEEAHGGTIFLDEIGDLPPELQVKLLRVLQERQIKPVGENAHRDVDVRIVAATNRNLAEMMHNGTFRDDLYYRLSVFELALPALKDRAEDIPLLADFFVKKYARTHSRNVREFGSAAAEKLLHHSWPGNVRELQNTVEKAVILADSQVIQPDQTMFSEIFQRPLAVQPKPQETQAPAVPPMADKTALVTLKEMESRYIIEVHRLMNGNKERTAKVLDIDRKTLYRKLRDTQPPATHDTPLV